MDMIRQVERMDAVAGSRLAALGLSNNLKLIGWKSIGPARKIAKLWLVPMERFKVKK